VASPDALVRPLPRWGITQRASLCVCVCVCLCVRNVPAVQNVGGNEDARGGYGAFRHFPSSEENFHASRKDGLATQAVSCKCAGVCPLCSPLRDAAEASIRRIYQSITLGNQKVIS
jgi:hypothetical protein